MIYKLILIALILISTKSLKSQENIDKVRGLLTYNPFSQGGRRLSETVAFPATALHKVAQNIADPVAKAGFPKTAATLATAVEAAPAVLGARQAFKTPTRVKKQDKKPLIKKL